MKRKKKNRVAPKPQETPIKMSEILMNYAWSYAIQDVEDPKKKQYPTIKKLVVSTEVFDDGEHVRCRAVSTDYDAMVKAKQPK